MAQNGKIVIITAPSGAGKTSITRYLLKTFPRLVFSVSAATRPQRNNEKNGMDYYFMSPADFMEKVRNDEFAEWEMVYEGKYYGTLKSELQRIWQNGQVPVLDVDVKGAIHLLERYRGTTLSIFIQPPSIKELKKRLVSRGTESEASLVARISKANYELSFRDQFHHVIINDEFEKACQEAVALVGNFLLEKGDALSGNPS